MVRASVVGMLITFGLVSASYIQFYKQLQLAAEGADPVIDRTLDRRLYDREDVRYPYKSRGQPLRAYYAVAASTLIVLFNGWGTLIPPVNEDFLGSYVSVRSPASLKNLSVWGGWIRPILAGLEL
jgi:yeast amino acid transporter